MLLLSTTATKWPHCRNRAPLRVSGPSVQTLSGARTENSSEQCLYVTLVWYRDIDKGKVGERTSGVELSDETIVRSIKSYLILLIS